MADAVISLILKKLDELISQEVKLLLGVKPQLESLRTQLRLINSFLKDVDSKRTKNPEVVKVWVGELRDAAYEAEDIIEAFSLGIDQHRRVGFMGSLIGCVVCINETPTRHELGEQIESIKSKIQQIFDQRINFGIEFKQTGEAPSTFNNKGPSELEKAAIAEGLDVVGFADPEKHMIDQLLQGEGQRTVISVVGMGGLGKTTITKKIYNRNEVESHFKCKAWITVSRHYTVDELLRDILKGILDCIPGTRREKQEITEMREEDLVNRLKGHLKNVKYLVVIDDIWQSEAWDKIKTALPIDSLGSRVMLTTRIKEVALYAQGIIHELPFLTEEESWELFCKKVFSKAHCPTELEEVGKEMVNKCRGLPLAIVVLGGLLSRKQQSRYEWQRIRDRLTHELSTERNEMIKNILTLSYDDLPYHLKLCFLYMGLFPEDAEIDATKLVHLWVAEDFIQQENGQTVEETAEGHLEELANRCIIQVVERDPLGLGPVTKCRIHDLLLDLATTEGEQNRILDVHGNATATHEVKSRRLAIQHNISNCVSSGSKCLSSKLRSLLCFSLYGQQEMHRLLIGLTLLRVIDLEGAPIELMPEEIGDMIHLKYLGLRRTKLASLPSSIRKLCRLETLDVMDIRKISLPDAVWNMKTLRHIHAWNVQPRTVCSNLRDLQTLYTANAGRWIQRSLEKLTNLRKLGIEGILDSHEKAVSDSIEKLTHLSFLRLEGSSIPNVLGLALTKHESLRFLSLKGEMGKLSKSKQELLPQNLTQVTLDGSKLETDPLALLEGLPDLCILRLFPNSFTGEEIICSTGGFPKLQELYLHGLTELQRWRLEDGAMCCLKSLTIKNCQKLEMLPEGLRHVTTLKELKLDNMPPEFTDKVGEDGADWYKIRHVPLVNIF